MITDARIDEIARKCAWKLVPGVFYVREGGLVAIQRELEKSIRTALREAQPATPAGEVAGKDQQVANLKNAGDTLEKVIAKLDARQERKDAEIAHLRAELAKAREALHEAINRPKGTVPDSALPFYDPSHPALQGGGE